jgi:ankyrin repeat protein
MRRWDIATLLLQAGASPTQTNRNHHRSPAHEFFSNWYPGNFSEETNRTAFLQALLEHGFDPFLPMQTGQEPSVSFIEDFLQRHGRHDRNAPWGLPAARGSRFIITSPASPTASPRPDLCAMMLTNRPSADRRTPSGETALHLAAYRGHTNALTFLLDAGFSPDLTNAAGLTALQSIAGLDAGGQITAADSIQLLLARDATVNVFTAAGLGPTKRVAELLQADPELANARDSFGRTPLHYVITAMPPNVGNMVLWGGRARVITGPAIPPATPLQLDSVTLLLTHNANPSAATFQKVPRISQSSESMPAGTTPLHLAAHRGHPALLRQLVAAKSSVTAADENGDTPLHIAARTWQSNSVHFLLLAKAPIEATNHAGHTPLRNAVEAGLTASAAQLIAAGASLTNGLGDTTLLHLAARTYTVDTTKLLRRHGP